MLPSGSQSGARRKRRRLRSETFVKHVEDDTHVLAVAGQKPDKASELLVEQLWEVEQRRPDEEGQEHDHEGVRNEFLAGGHHVDAECNLVAIVFQTDAVDAAFEKAATLAGGGGRRTAAGRRHCGGILADELVHDLRRVRRHMGRSRRSIEGVHLSRHRDLIVG